MSRCHRFNFVQFGKASCAIRDYSFNNGNSGTSNDYTYDANGNMTKDLYLDTKFLSISRTDGFFDKKLSKYTTGE